jgi:hypothetical protein
MLSFNSRAVNHYESLCAWSTWSSVELFQYQYHYPQVKILPLAQQYSLIWSSLILHDKVNHHNLSFKSFSATADPYAYHVSQASKTSGWQAWLDCNLWD